MEVVEQASVKRAKRKDDVVVTITENRRVSRTIERLKDERAFLNDRVKKLDGIKTPEMAQIRLRYCRMIFFLTDTIGALQSTTEGS